MTIFAAHCSNATDKQEKRLKWTLRKFHKKAGRMWQHKVYKEVIVSNFLDGSDNFYNQTTSTHTHTHTHTHTQKNVELYQ